MLCRRPLAIALQSRFHVLDWLHSYRCCPAQHVEMASWQRCSAVQGANVNHSLGGYRLCKQRSMIGNGGSCMNALIDMCYDGGVLQQPLCVFVSRTWGCRPPAGALQAVHGRAPVPDHESRESYAD